MLSNVIQSLCSDYKIKIDDIKNAIDVDIHRFNNATEAIAKGGLVIRIFLPQNYLGKIELGVNARHIKIFNIKNELIEVSGKISEILLEQNKSEIEIDSNLDMLINVISHEGALEINQLSATSRMLVPAGYRFRSVKKGIAISVFYEKYGEKVEDFSDPLADNYIEFNGMKSELIIAVDN